MPISGYVITYKTGEKDSVLSALNKMPEVVIGSEHPENSRLSIAIDVKDEGGNEAIADNLKEIQGIESADLVYYNFEDTLIEKNTQS